VEEFEVQKALGLSVWASCEIVYTINTISPFQTHKFRDIIFETCIGDAAHLNNLAREWLKEQNPGATFIHVSILYNVPRKGLGKYNGSNSTP